MQRSIAENKLEGHVQAVLGDIRDLKGAFVSESFDLVIANPPYRNSGKMRQVGKSACHEVTANLEDFFKASRLFWSNTEAVLLLFSYRNVSPSVWLWPQNTAWN